MRRKGSMCLIDEHSGTGHLVQFAKRGGIVAGKGFKELNRCGDYNRSLPEKGKLARLQILELCPMMVSRYNIFRAFSDPDQGPSVYLDRLVNDIREGQDHEYAAETFFSSGAKQVGHDRCGFPCADGAITGIHARPGGSVSACFVNLIPQCSPFVFFGFGEEPDMSV
jgi:hypothetical protein